MDLTEKQKQVIAKGLQRSLEMAHQLFKEYLKENKPAPDTLNQKINYDFFPDGYFHDLKMEAPTAEELTMFDYKDKSPLYTEKE
jgi:hypothetical protein